MKKAPSKVRLAVRELQLVLSVGCALLILYAMVFGTVAAHIDRPNTDNQTVLLLLAVLLQRGPLLLLAPVVCFLVRWVVDVNPWRLGLGAVLFVEATFQVLRWVTGFFDEGGVIDASFAVQVAFSLVAGVLAALAAKKAGTLVAAHMAGQEAAAVGPNPGGAKPAPDLAEQMRAIQSQTQAPTPSADLAEQMRAIQSAPPPSTQNPPADAAPAEAPAPTGTEPPKS